jgi:hypothetical protein
MSAPARISNRSTTCLKLQYNSSQIMSKAVCRERNTAIHEAGHAVASYFLHHRILRATIVPKPGSLGHVRHTRLKFSDQGMFDDSLRGTDRAEKHIVICYAGPLAARKFAPRSQWRQSGIIDFDIASELFSHLDTHDDEYNRLYAKLLWRQAQLLVDLRWREINAVADDLVQHRTLNADGVRAAIHRSLGVKHPNYQFHARDQAEIDRASAAHKQ